MKKHTLVILSIIIISSVGIIPFVADQTAGAGSTKKIHFTKTITSIQDPGIGHEGHQLALILSPNSGTLYDGSLTFTASKPVQIFVLHEITSNDMKGQPIWSVNNQTTYALTLIDSKSAGSFEFTGAALALHSPDSDEFSATVSIDGWIRGQPPEVIMQQIQVQKEEPSIKLARANVPATIPLHKGIYNNEDVYYIITDTNDKEYANQLTETQGWKVEVAPPLSNTPQDALETVYLFTNGLPGDGIYGYQEEVFSSTPQQTDDYSALRKIVEITWKPGQKPSVLNSEEEVLQAKKSGRIEFKEKEAILNMPQIIWPQGQMPVRENATITDDMEYGGAQIIDIDLENMTVTFIAHRGWGPNGQTIYYIITDATPSGPAEMMGIIDTPSYSDLINTSAAVDLFQFTNGLKGSGPMGFQPGIAAAMPGDENYSPMWRIFLVEWNDPKDASLLETKADIDALSSQDLITVSIARPLNLDFIVNCPFIDPFQNLTKG